MNITHIQTMYNINYFNDIHWFYFHSFLLTLFFTDHWVFCFNTFFAFFFLQFTSRTNILPNIIFFCSLHVSHFEGRIKVKNRKDEKKKNTMIHELMALHIYKLMLKRIYNKNHHAISISSIEIA